MPLKYGRRPPKNAPALRLGPLLTGAVPAHPAAADYLAALGGGWKMLGNDEYGDCVAVTWANVRRLMSATLGGAVDYPPQAQVIAFYKTQNPGFPAQDDGMDIQTALEYLAKTGGPDGVKAVAFAKVDHTNVDEVKAAIGIFGYVWTGIQVLDANMDEFNAGEPWDYVARSAIDGAHSVITGGYGPAGAGPLGGDERFITWAAETSFTAAYWQHEVEECWVVIWPEHFGTKAFVDGVNVAQLAADYQALTGRTLPVPAPPTPAPVPTPTPTPDQPTPADVAFAAVLNGTDRPGHPWIDEHHVAYNHKVQQAAISWLQAKGLYGD
jgi:hypothetical protein